MPDPSQTVLIFDLDNTLIHSTIDFLGIRRLLIALLSAHGVVSGTHEEMMRLAIPELVDLGAKTSEALGSSMWDVVAAAEAEGLKDALPDPQARPVLEELRRRGYRLAVLTNSARGAVAAKLDEFGLTALFNCLATRSEVTEPKPSAAGIRYILDQMPGIARAIVIGDAWIDGTAARQAGIPFIGIGSKRDAVLERGIRPWAWITDLRELLDLELEV